MKMRGEVSKFQPSVNLDSYGLYFVLCNLNNAGPLSSKTNKSKVLNKTANETKVKPKFN